MSKLIFTLLESTVLLYDVLCSGVIDIHLVGGILDGFAPFIHLVYKVFPSRLVQLDVASDDLLGLETEVILISKFDALFHNSLVLQRFSLHLITLQVLAMPVLNIE